jgi:outer membrane protein assembly factor BamA
MMFGFRHSQKTVCLFWIAFFTSMAFAQIDSRLFVLNEIKMTGLKRFDPEPLIEISGLETGKTISVPDINDAAGRLAESGFFKSVSYKYSYMEDKINIDFQVEEAADFLPCVFDNFIWFRNEELLDAVQKKIPVFNGLLPQSGTAIQVAEEAIGDLLRERRLPGTVTSILSQEKAGGKVSRRVFKISDIKLPIAMVKFPGAAVIPETELQQRAQSLLGQNYSGSYIEKYANSTLAPLFLDKGCLRVQFKPPTAMLQVDSTPGNGITVTMEVIEGPVYSWGGAIWTGKFPFKQENLGQILGMKTGEPADESRIQKGMEAIQKAARNKGFLDIQSSSAPEFDDSAGKVTFNIQLTSGPQYRMGAVTFKNLPDDIAAQLHAKWKLMPGDVFDESYYEMFVRSGFIGIRYKQIKTSVRPDRTRNTVDVTYEIVSN